MNQTKLKVLKLSNETSTPNANTDFGNSTIVSAAAFLLQLIIYGFPVAICLLPFLMTQNLGLKIFSMIAAPIAYAFFYGTTAGLLSKFFQKGIIKGVFPRKTGHPVYAMRKLYATCWTSLYYFKPVYGIILNVPVFKAIVFRLFGYKGSLNAVFYPDAWIRDLPLLRIEDGAYIANKATLGSNICLIDGTVMTGNITLMKGSMVGHLSIVGMGSRLGERSEIGADCALGMHVKIGNDVKIGSCTAISHGAKIGDNVEIGVTSFIGTGAVIGDNLKLPSNISIPDRAEVHTQEDIMQYVNTQPRAAMAPVRDPYYDMYKRNH